MSSRAVRTLCRQWAAALPVPFHDTVGLDVDPTDPMWCSLEFMADYKEKLSYCDQWNEIGTITLMFFGSIGTGDDALLAAAEPAAQQFFSQTDPTGRLVLDSINPPDIFSPQDGPWLIAEFQVRYSFQTP
jgi:hypothetical protein